MTTKRPIQLTAAAFVAASLVLLACLAAVAVAIEKTTVDTRPSHAAPPIVYAERSGLRVGTQALTGRVALVASEARLRWRIDRLTPWQYARGRVLVRAWDTRRIADGRYRLVLERGDMVRTQALVVRNRTPLRGSALAIDTAGLKGRQNDARAVVAQFRRPSYRPGDVATLRFWGRYRTVLVQVLHAGPEQQATRGNETMEGVPVRAPVLVAGVHRSFRFRVGSWESGLYFVRMTSGRKVGFAPFVVRPRRLGEHPVAVVEPTNTWQAYNYRSADGDGVPDTWYADGRRTTVDTSRPYLDRGVPPHFRMYDVSFLRWLAQTHKHVDMLAQEDLERIPGRLLARLYRLIVFPGHHEYVTEAEYDAVQRYRDLGGNLAFLSANNFFSRVDRHGYRLTRIGRWRDLGRPEAALVGAQYFWWNAGNYDSRPYRVVGADRVPWLFEGTGIVNGERFGCFGIEVDARTSASPPRTLVIARMRNALGTHRSAEMTYYTTRRGAHVFAAGAFTLSSRQIWRRAGVGPFLENLWTRLAA
jgi:N,N-dimethylformamidase beta subunit-like protein